MWRIRLLFETIRVQWPLRDKLPNYFENVSVCAQRIVDSVDRSLSVANWIVQITTPDEYQWEFHAHHTNIYTHTHGKVQTVRCAHRQSVGWDNSNDLLLICKTHDCWINTESIYYIYKYLYGKRKTKSNVCNNNHSSSSSRSISSGNSNCRSETVHLSKMIYIIKSEFIFGLSTYSHLRQIDSTNNVMSNP